MAIVNVTVGPDFPKACKGARHSMKELAQILNRREYEHHLQTININNNEVQGTKTKNRKTKRQSGIRTRCHSRRTATGITFGEDAIRKRPSRKSISCAEVFSTSNRGYHSKNIKHSRLDRGIPKGTGSSKFAEGGVVLEHNHEGRWLPSTDELMGHMRGSDFIKYVYNCQDEDIKKRIKERWQRAKDLW